MSFKHCDIEEHNLNDIGKLFHNELPLYLIHICP